MYMHEENTVHIFIHWNLNAFPPPPKFNKISLHTHTPCFNAPQLASKCWINCCAQLIILHWTWGQCCVGSPWLQLLGWFIALYWSTLTRSVDRCTGTCTLHWFICVCVCHVMCVCVYDLCVCVTCVCVCMCHLCVCVHVSLVCECIMCVCVYVCVCVHVSHAYYTYNWPTWSSPSC